MKIKKEDQYAKICQECQNLCKQSKNVEILRCPFYQKENNVESNEKET